ncbi:YqcI/YcgG family protein [Leuconostoc rapi]|uniref:YqcI/YcgG family protein n=1 Tax=Leuconostoc rapi TaxID=1406906 RepID=UPI00195E0955|nr:YqcI/YcgG family protein [Leuconostoc rapi]MBM7436301.1 FPC/CPF motif-containing protein YcgG [Leuconostoc rapi]
MLVSLEAVHQGQIPSEKWQVDALNAVRKSLETQGFPCVFGVSGYRKNTHFFSFLDFPYRIDELKLDMVSYLENIKDTVKDVKKTGIAGLMIIFQPISPRMSINQRRFLTWQTLTEMKKKYEPNQPFNPENDDFAFEFLGETWFVNFSSEAYQHRNSRKIGVFAALITQPLSMSDAYFEHSNVKKAKGQKAVRLLAERFDKMPVHPGLGPVIGESEKPFPMKLSYYVGDRTEDPSFEPWKYQSLSGLPIYIDEQLLTDSQLKNDVSVLLEYKKVELINISKVPEFDHDVLIVSSQKLMRAHVHSVVLDENSEESITHVSTLIDVLGAFEEKVI